MALGAQILPCLAFTKESLPVRWQPGTRSAPPIVSSPEWHRSKSFRTRTFQLSEGALISMEPTIITRIKLASGAVMVACFDFYLYINKIIIKFKIRNILMEEEDYGQGTC